MNKIKNTTELQARILELQIQGKDEMSVLKNQISVIVDNVNPIQILTHGIKEIIKSPEVKHELLGLTLGMSAGYITRKIVVGKSKNIIQHIAGNVLGMVVSKNVALNLEKIQSTAFSFLSNLITKNKLEEENNNEDRQ